MMRKKLIALPLALLLGTASMAATISRTELDAFKPAPAQALVDKIIARNPDMLDVLLHVTPPTGDRNLVVAAHVAANLGEISGEDDLSVADTGKPIVEVQKDGVRIGVLLQLHDARQRPIGAIGLMFPWHGGDRQQAFLKRAVAIRDQLSRSIPSRAALFG